MPPPAQYAANRLNALKIPDPTFNERRSRSEINASRHGVTARVVVLPTEDLAAYKQFAREIVDSLDAQTPLERQFAHTIADNQWRINRFRSVEDGMLGLGHSEAAGDFDADHPEIHAVMTAAKAFRDHSQAFVNLSICEQRLHRSLKDALRQLKELQAERRCTAGGLAAGALPKSELGFVLQNPPSAISALPEPNVSPRGAVTAAVAAHPPQAGSPPNPDPFGFVLQNPSADVLPTTSAAAVPQPGNPAQSEKIGLPAFSQKPGLGSFCTEPELPPCPNHQPRPGKTPPVLLEAA